MKIQILVDNPDSWIWPYERELRERLSLDHDAQLISNQREVSKGDILCLLSCEHIFKKLDLNKHNLVVHESSLPKGRGWSPLTWQILEGTNEIPISLFEAELSVDSGVIYYEDRIKFSGHELLAELKDMQGKKTIELIMKFVQDYPRVKGRSQTGEATYYRRRTAQDSQISIHKTIDDQFNLLRVCDNQRYPAFFVRDGIRYLVKIEKE